MISFTQKASRTFNIYKRIKTLASYLIQRLEENNNIKVITPLSHAGLVSWKHKSVNCHEIVSKL